MSEAARKPLDELLEPHVDVRMMIAFMLLLGLGVIMVASTTMEMAQSKYGDAFYLFRKQLVFVVIGLLSIWVLRSIRLSFWESSARVVLMLGIALLGAVFVPAVGHSSHNAYRWLMIGGVSIQVSEFIKIAMIIYLADYMVRHQQRLATELGAFLAPIGVVAIVNILLLLEPDFGAAVVLTTIVLTMLYLGGVRHIPFVFIGVVAVVALALIAITERYRLNRLISFLDPWADPTQHGYQLIQSLIAIGDGGMWGKGLGSSVQKLFYLPEAHNDFVFAVLAEELGIVGVVVLLTAYLLMITSAFSLAGKCAAAGMKFAQHVMCGCAVWFALQTAVSVGVNMGVLPTKGLSLPFVSAGGSNLLASCVAVGLMMRVHLEYQWLSSRAHNRPRKRQR